MNEASSPRLGGPLRLWRALGVDLQVALARGAVRDPWPCPTAVAWLTHAALAALVLGAGLWLLVDYHAGFVRLNTAAAELPGALWQALTVLGDERVVFALSLFFARRHPRVLWALVAAGLLAAVYSYGLKAIVVSGRPPAVLEPGSFNLIGPGHRSDSFPSGHSVTAGVFCGVLALFARRRAWRAGLIVLAVAIGVSRVAVGVHWPVDVGFGLAGGWLAALLGVGLARRSQNGICSRTVHLAIVALAGIVTAGLWFDDVGYPAAAPALRLICAAALATALLGYVLLPLCRALCTRSPAG